MKLKLLIVTALILAMSACGNDKSNKETVSESAKKEIKKEAKTEPEKLDPKTDKGVGPVKSVSIDEKIDEKLAEEGKKLFKANCTACHKINKRYIGPALKGITKKQTPEWIMNMILNPEVMIVENATAKELLKEYSAPMANQHLTQDQARAIYEYFRTKN